MLLLVGALLSLLKGFDWEEASLLSLTAALLAMFRRSFYRPSRLMEVPFSPLYVGASICVVGASVWLLLFANQDVHYSNQLWWQFALDADAPRALRAALGSCLLLLALALGWLLRAAPPAIREPNAEELQRAARIIRHSDQPDGGLALTGDKALLFHESDDAFLMYARRGRSMIALYDPIGPAMQRAELIWQFRDLCDLHHARPVFYQVRAENLPFYMDIGLTALKLGEEARVDLLRFDLENKGKEMKDLRYTWNRGQRDGLALEFHEPGQAPLDELKAISDAWLGGKQVRERLLPGPLHPDVPELLPHRHRPPPGQAGGLRQPAGDRQPRTGEPRPDARAPGRAEADHGVPHARPHPPLQGPGPRALQPRHGAAGRAPARRGAPLTQRLGALVFRRGEQFYNFQGLRRFRTSSSPTGNPATWPCQPGSTRWWPWPIPPR